MHRVISLAIVGLIGIGMMSLDQNGKGKGKGNNGGSNSSSKNSNSPKNSDISITIKNPKQPQESPKDVFSDKGNGKPGRGNSHGHKSKNGKGNNNNHKDHHPAHSNGNHFGKHKDGMTGKEFGQYRAAQARAKHKPKSEKDAIHIIEVVHIENVSLLGSIKDKMERVRDRIEDRFRTGFLTRNVYEMHKKRIDLLENRRKALHKLLIP